MMKKYQKSKIKNQIDKANIKNIFYILYVFFIFTILYFIFGMRQARAQSLALSISPPLLEVLIKPGKSITQVYKLTNSGEPTVITLKLVELTEFGIKENEEFVPEKWISIISNDIAFDKPFILGTDKTAELLIKVSPPAGTTEQDYYRALVFATTPTPFTDATMSSFSQNLVSPLLVSVTGTGVLTQAAQIAKFQLPRILDSFDGLSADIDVKNSGKNYFRPKGIITLVGPVGRGSFDLVPNVIFAGQTRKLLTEYIPPETRELKTLFLAGFYIGKYQLTLDFTLDESSQKVTAVRTFYAVPWKAGLVLLAVLIMILWKRRRKS